MFDEAMKAVLGIQVTNRTGWKIFDGESLTYNNTENSCFTTA